MASYRRKRSYRTRRGGALSARRVYSRTSARAQASQIMKLNRKINSLYRRFKPETKVILTPATQHTYTNETASATYRCYPSANIEPGTSDQGRIGNFVRVKSLTWYFTFEYRDTKQSTGVLPDSEGCPFRIIIGQYKRPVSPTAVPTAAEVIDRYASTGGQYTHNVVSPLSTNITATHKILTDRKFTITADSNQKLIRIRVKPDNFRFDSDGNFNNVWVMIVASGLHWDMSTSFMQYLSATISNKVVYTDA